MRFKVFKNTVLFPIIIGIITLVIACGNKMKSEPHPSEQEGQNLKDTLTAISTEVQNDKAIIVGANQTETYIPLLKGKRVGIVANQTSVIFKKIATISKKSRNDISFTHIVDSLLKHKIAIKKVFAPEHGFRGKADAGEVVKDGIDIQTGLPIVSLYGKNKKPTTEQLQDLDIVVFDIQDVGARFYTYISSLHYVMEACAEQDIPILILDRPNPNGHYIDGPILELKHKSFVGMHPVPVVHGMTIGEYAQMINGEGWLANGVTCDITVIPVENYTHEAFYSLPIKPSPNLPNDDAIHLYPSLCFFEGTNVSVGRGTNMQFQVIGSPFVNSEEFDFEFTPEANEGAKYPKHEGKICYGSKLHVDARLNHITLGWLIRFYNATKAHQLEEVFFNNFFTKLAGTKTLQQQIEAGMSAHDIWETWQDDLGVYKKVRAKYLIYDD